MAWLELHQTLPTNKKTLRLKSILKIKTPQAIGHLCMIWLWALDNAGDGDLSGFTADEIAEVAAWQGKNPQVFIDGLIYAGFLDPDMHLHDWSEYAGKLIDKRKTDMERKRTIRENKKASNGRPMDKTRTTAGNPEDGAGNSTVQYSTVPNQEAILIDSTNTTTGVFKEQADVPAVVDPVLARVMGVYQDKINAQASGEVLSGLREYLKAIDPETVLKAFDIALDERKPTWSYINGILRAWRAKGIQSMLDLQQAQDEYNRRKQEPKARDKPKTPSEQLREMIERGEFEE